MQPIQVVLASYQTMMEAVSIFDAQPPNAIMQLPLSLHLYHVKAPPLRSRFPLPILVATLRLVLDS